MEWPVLGQQETLEGFVLAYKTLRTLHSMLTCTKGQPAWYPAKSQLLLAFSASISHGLYCRKCHLTQRYRQED